MGHVKKGCLARSCDPSVRTDGSRVEGSHKGWNSLMRASPSGLEMMTGLAADFALRRNVRVIDNSKEFTASPFAASTFGSHHVGLVNRNARHWNTIVSRHGRKSMSGVTQRKQLDSAVLVALPVLADVQSGEVFGVTTSRYAETFAGLIKLEISEDDDVLLLDCTEQEDAGCPDDLGTAARSAPKPEPPIDPVLLVNISPPPLRSAQSESLAATVNAAPSVDVVYIDTAPSTSTANSSLLHTSARNQRSTASSSDTLLALVAEPSVVRWSPDAPAAMLEGIQATTPLATASFAVPAGRTQNLDSDKCEAAAVTAGAPSQKRRRDSLATQQHQNESQEAGDSVTITRKKIRVEGSLSRKDKVRGTHSAHQNSYR